MLKQTSMRTTRLFTLLALLMVFAVSCNKPDEPNNGNNDSDVRVTTYTPQDIYGTTAKCGGDVIVTQGLSINELGICWSKEHNPTANQFHLSTTHWDEPFVCTISGLEPSTQYYVRAYALRGLEYYYGEEKSFSTTEYNGIGVYNNHEYIDLGLPSGTMWATCNVGASFPEEFGDYFAWGETESKNTYNFETYKYCNGHYSMLTKYCNQSYYGYNGYTDNLTVLQSSDDAATANWGNGWNMPTTDQWEELFQNTTNEWTMQNGVNGRLFTSTNGNKLFFPSAGARLDNNLNEDYGEYWSSSLNIYNPYAAMYLSFDSGYYLVYAYANRSNGLTVRPVVRLNR